MTEKNDLIAWAIDLRERFPHWPYKKPKPGHEGFRLLDGPAPNFHRMTVEEFEALPPHIWMDVKKTLPPLEHPVLTVDAYGNYHTNTEYIDNPEIPFCITEQRPHTRHRLGEYAQGRKAAGRRPPCCGFSPGADSSPDGRACRL